MSDLEDGVLRKILAENIGAQNGYVADPAAFGDDHLALKCMREALRRAALHWRPIAEAVKDERVVDLWFPPVKSAPGYRMTDCWWGGYRAYAGHGGQQNTVIKYGWVREFGGHVGVDLAALIIGEEPTHFMMPPEGPI